LTYKDIIDDKVAEWQRDLQKLEERSKKASVDTRARLRMKIEQLKAAINTARFQLYTLDEQETADNTMETKDRILQIFDSIDRDFPWYDDKTPFMI
jgi:FtsZ-binding cell division protein ZapB